MEAKTNVKQFKSMCPTQRCSKTKSQCLRAIHDLPLIREAIETLSGEIKDYAIRYDDWGEEIETELGPNKDQHRWNWVTSYTIQLKKYGGRDLQDYIDELEVSSAALEVFKEAI